METIVTLKSIKSEEKWLSVIFAAGQTRRFHWLWLRENCLCHECHHPQTWERVVDTWSIDREIKAEKSFITEDGSSLTLLWADGHETTISSDWLFEHAYDGDHADDGLPPAISWSTETLKDRPTIEAEEVLHSDEGVMTFVRQIKENGFSIVKNLAPEMGMVETLAKRVGFLRDTHFGIDFTVESKPVPNNVAYTAIELKAHTDLPNLEMPPGIQFLHCLHFDADGGESILVDGFAVAEQLKIENPKAFDDLTRIPVLYRFVDKEWDLRWHSAPIRLDHNGNLEEVRYHTGA